MVTIVTGGLDSCKTTKLTSLYAETRRGDGFAMIKRLAGRHVRGYDARRLSTGVELPLVYREGFEPAGLDFAWQIGPYLFAATAFARVETELRDLVARRVAPIYFDEIGELELAGGGFDAAMREMVSSGLDLCIVVREDFVPRVIAKYGIGAYRLVDSI